MFCERVNRSQAILKIVTIIWQIAYTSKWRLLLNPKVENRYSYRKRTQSYPQVDNFAAYFLYFLLHPDSDGTWTVHRLSPT